MSNYPDGMREGDIPGYWDDYCPSCEGAGEIDGEECSRCDGTGSIDTRDDDDAEERKADAYLDALEAGDYDW